MNQKNIFTVVAAILILQGIAFFFMGNTMAGESFPNLDDAGKGAVAVIMEVLGLLSVTIGLITYAVRGNNDVLWAYLLGFVLLTANTLKHRFIDDLNVPIPAMVIQVGILLACVYLWTKNRSSSAS